MKRIALFPKKHRPTKVANLGTVKDKYWSHQNITGGLKKYALVESEHAIKESFDHETR